MPEAATSPVDPDGVIDARERLKRRFSNKNIPEQSKINTPNNDREESKKEVKTGRTWVTINNKVDKKALKNVEVSQYAEENATVDIQAEMEKYLGGDDEVLDGFFNSDEEVDFDTL